MTSIVPEATAELLLSRYAYSLGTSAAPPRGFEILAASATSGILIARTLADQSRCYVALRGTRPNSIDDLKSDAAIVRGKISFTDRAQKCREFMAGWAVPEGVQSITFTGHSLGGSLAIELLNNVLCLPRFRPYEVAAIVFNPGWARMTRHYKLSAPDFFRAVTIYRIDGDMVSMAILRSRFNDYKRVVTISMNPKLTGLKAHSINAFFSDFVDLSSNRAPLLQLQHPTPFETAAPAD